MRQSLIFNKVTGLRPTALLKKETLAPVFHCEFSKIFKNTFFAKHLCATAFLLLQTIGLNAKKQNTNCKMLNAE